jgi:hypothetical protein
MSNSAKQAGGGDGVPDSVLARLGGPKVAIVHLAGLALALAATASASAWLVVPRVMTYVRSEQGNRDLASVRASITNSEQQLKLFRAESERLENDLRQVVTLRPHDTINAQLGTIATLADAHRLSLRTIQPGLLITSPKQRGFAIMPITIGGSVSYADIVGFLRELREKQRDVRVMGMKLQQATTTREQGTNPLAYELELAWYTLAPALEATPGAAPGAGTGPSTQAAANER